MEQLSTEKLDYLLVKYANCANRAYEATIRGKLLVNHWVTYHNVVRRIERMLFTRYISE